MAASRGSSWKQERNKEPELQGGRRCARQTAHPPPNSVDLKGRAQESVQGSLEWEWESARSHRSGDV